MTNLPERLRQLSESLNDWDNPITAKDDCLNAAKELERLHAIVGKLPKTADGVPVTADMTLWYVNPNGVVPTTSFTFDDICECLIDGNGPKLYSTREAAEAAKSKGRKP